MKQLLIIISIAFLLSFTDKSYTFQLKDSEIQFMNFHKIRAIQILQKQHIDLQEYIQIVNQLDSSFLPLAIKYNNELQKEKDSLDKLTPNKPK